MLWIKMWKRDTCLSSNSWKYSPNIAYIYNCVKKEDCFCVNNA